MKIFPSNALLKIPIRDNGEELVNLKKQCPDIIIDIHPQSRRLQHLQKDECYLREGAAKKICEAQKSLPKGYKFMIWEAHRPLQVQQQMHTNYYNELKASHPTWSKEELKQKTKQFVASVDDVPPHLTGGTVDLTIVDSNNEPLNMGTKYLEFNNRTRTDCKTVSKKVKNNRTLLINAMEPLGFVNYPLEWWHWSYGDRYWAAVLNKKYSIYGGIL